MEGNKDEALKCLHLATKFLSSGHREKAKKFINKSLKLYPTDKARELLNQIDSHDPHSNGSVPNAENVRRRRRTNSGHRDTQAEEPAEKNYTDEQVQEILRIKNCKDYYEVLGVSKTHTEAELKKSYRKLALRFHPDKNKAPGATEAFKRISVAFDVLRDPDKKQRYDTHGESLGPSATRRHRGFYEDEFEGDISPEDLFNMFFGGGFPAGHVNVRRGGRHARHGRHTFFTHQQHQNEGVSSMYPLLQILPVLLIVLFSLLSSFLIPEPLYSFQRTSQYRYPMTTERYKFQYFVKDHEIRKKHSVDEFHTIEAKIEREYIETLQVRCYRERQYKAELHHQARIWGSQELFDKANRYHTESCERLDRIRG